MEWRRRRARDEHSNRVTSPVAPPVVAWAAVVAVAVAVCATLRAHADIPVGLNREAMCGGACNCGRLVHSMHAGAVCLAWPYRHRLVEMQ